jgi:hypothetical protein
MAPDLSKHHWNGNLIGILQPACSPLPPTSLNASPPATSVAPSDFPDSMYERTRSNCVFVTWGPWNVSSLNGSPTTLVCFTCSLNCFTNSSYTPSWTRILDVAVHTWPWLYMMPICAHFTACSSSASSKTRRGDLPPVSRVMFSAVQLAYSHALGSGASLLMFTEAIFIISFPVAVDPVKATLSTPRC